MKLTSALFEAYLKCPTKCYLRSTGQTGAGNAYAEWVREQNDAYRKEGVQGLVTAAVDGIAATTLGAENLKTATWQLAVDLSLETETMASRLHAVERMASLCEGASTRCGKTGGYGEEFACCVPALTQRCAGEFRVRVKIVPSGRIAP